MARKELFLENCAIRQKLLATYKNSVLHYWEFVKRKSAFDIAPLHEIQAFI